ncbi:CLUMA_CG003605, isoform A [Clunio marinus]|uniref:CLUMA_CG003605, isoform A n=1 Tax=Clunio marinus TaxID=568069 RepID=A0A1J1HPC2_9DIPT|nr:CLUMA_CG003605, isoform A [Clunio marinus]
MSEKDRASKLAAKEKISTIIEIENNSGDSSESQESVTESIYLSQDISKTVINIEAEDTLKSTNFKMADKKPALTREISLVPTFVNSNVIKFISACKQFHDLMKDFYTTNQIILALTTKLNEMDHTMIQSHDFDTFDDFINYITSRGRSNRTPNEVLQEIYDLKQGKFESLRDYSARIDYLKTEYETTEMISNRPKFFKEEKNLLSFLAESAIKGLKPIYRSKCTEVSLDFKELRTFMNKAVNEIFAYENKPFEAEKFFKSRQETRHDIKPSYNPRNWHQPRGNSPNNSQLSFISNPNKQRYNNPQSFMGGFKNSNNFQYRNKTNGFSGSDFNYPNHQVRNNFNHNKNPIYPSGNNLKYPNHQVRNNFNYNKNSAYPSDYPSGNKPQHSAFNQQSVIWSDKVFIEDYCSNIPYKHPDTATIFQSAKSIIECIVLGQIRDSLLNSMLVVILTTPSVTPGKLMFEHLMNNSGTSLSNLGVVVGLGNFDNSTSPKASRKTKEQEFPGSNLAESLSGDNQEEDQDDGFSSMDDEENFKLWKSLYEAFSEIEVKKDWRSTEFSSKVKWALGVLSFASLMSLRVIVKKPESVLDSFKLRYRGHATQFFAAYGTGEAPIPSLKFLNKFQTIAQPGIEPIRKILSLCVLNYIVNNSLKDSSMQDRGFLEAGLLIHTQMNGLGPIKLYEEAANYLNLKIAELAKNIASKDIVNSLTKWFELVAISPLVTNTISPSAVSWGWSRLFDNNFFASFNSKDHLKLTVRLAGILRISESRANICSMAILDNPVAKNLLNSDEQTATYIHNKFKPISMDPLIYTDDSSFESETKTQQKENSENQFTSNELINPFYIGSEEDEDYEDNDMSNVD